MQESTVKPETSGERKLEAKAQADYIKSAIEGSLGEHQHHIACIGVEVISTLLKKNQDYGSSVFKSPLLDQSLHPRSAILVRISDKVERLINLNNSKFSKKPLVNETYEDTLRDLCGYVILYLTSLHIVDEGRPAD